MESRGELPRPRVGQDVLLPVRVVQVVEPDGKEPVFIVRPLAIINVGEEVDPTHFAARLGELERP